MQISIKGCDLEVATKAFAHQVSVELFSKIFLDNNLAPRDNKDAILNLAASSQHIIQAEVISHQVPENYLVTALKFEVGGVDAEKWP